MKFYRLSYTTFYDRINTIYQFIKPFVGKTMSIFLRNMEPLMRWSCYQIQNNKKETVREWQKLLSVAEVE